MAKNEKRFIIVEKPVTAGAHVVDVFVDCQTRVQYLSVSIGSGGGLTVLVDAAGKPLLYEGNLD
ncbi:DUF6440 family protein [Lacticaseibacillus suibinensis]|uniref:DUF6440 family protein n=1 Tax=Lacticaseibacillus suibinensis TaxID=2486011 RepID=UPI000F7A4CAE|nr:DUF6440 family protein [Lacticaseibacillus suibinensis]